MVDNAPRPSPEHERDDDDIPALEQLADDASPKRSPSRLSRAITGLVAKITGGHRRAPETLAPEDVAQAIGDLLEREEPQSLGQQTHQYLPALKAQRQLDEVAARRPWIERHGLRLLVALLLCTGLIGGSLVIYGLATKRTQRPRVSSAPVGPTAQGLSAHRAASGENPSSQPEIEVARGSARGVMFARHGEGIVVQVDLRNGTNKAKVAMLFDTGATLTTLNRETIEALGIEVPERAPALTTQMVSGTIKTRAVVIDGVGVGGAQVSGGLTVSVCDRCGSDGVVGLLGLNFARHFQVTIDSAAQRLSLEAKQPSPGHVHDIRPFVELVDARSYRSSSEIFIEVWVHNRSPRTLHDLRIVAKTTPASAVILTGRLSSLGPYQRIKARLSGRAAGEGAQTFEVELADARW